MGFDDRKILNWLQLTCTTELPSEDIESLDGVMDKEGNIFVRITRKHPYIDIFCKDITEARRIYREIAKELKVVDLQAYKNSSPRPSGNDL